MKYILLSQDNYAYDIHSLVKAFFPSEDVLVSNDITKLKENGCTEPDYYIELNNDSFSISASGLEGWASELGIAPLCFAEINTDFFESKLQLKFGRHRREWASMDDGSSLVLNKNARPFFAGEVLFQPFKFLKYSSLGLFSSNSSSKSFLA